MTNTTTQRRRRRARLFDRAENRRITRSQTLLQQNGGEPQWSEDEKVETDEQEKKKLKDRQELWEQVVKAFHNKKTEFQLTDKFLGEGTVGSTFVSCKMEGPDGGKQSCQYAAKIQRISGTEQKKMFEKEVSNHKNFGKLAPEVHHHEILEHNGQEFGIIIMDKLHMMLDDYLVEKRNEAELKKVADQVLHILSKLDEKKFTHGDTTLFNIALDVSGKIVLFDLDRASTNPKHFHKSLDFLRFRIELYKTTQSRGTKAIHYDNLKTLRNLTSQWDVPAYKKNEKGKITLVGAKELEKNWERMFVKYAKKAKVRGMEG